MTSPKTGRRPRRFFSQEPLESPGQSLRLSLSETRHLREVLRLQKGDKCLVIDGLGRSGEARVEGETSDGLAHLVLEGLTSTMEIPRLQIRIYPALLQKGKIDDLVEKAQELAVQEILPTETKHTVLKMDENAKMKVLLRWNKIAREAAKQSGSSQLVRISAPQKFEKAVAGVPEKEWAVLFHPCEEAEAFAGWAPKISGGETLHLFLGPEGGFSDSEVQAFSKRRGKKSVVELGDTLLKADTAFIGVVSALRFLFP